MTGSEQKGQGDPDLARARWEAAQQALKLDPKAETVKVVPMAPTSDDEPDAAALAEADRLSKELEQGRPKE